MAFYISEGNSELGVRFVSAGHDKAQISCSICPCLQGVTKTALLIKACDVSVYIIHIE